MRIPYKIHHACVRVCVQHLTNVSLCRLGYRSTHIHWLYWSNCIDFWVDRIRAVWFSSRSHFSSLWMRDCLSPLLQLYVVIMATIVYVYIIHCCCRHCLRDALRQLLLWLTHILLHTHTATTSTWFSLAVKMCRLFLWFAPTLTAYVTLSTYCSYK